MCVRALACTLHAHVCVKSVLDCVRVCWGVVGCVGLC